jgi:hypothetical protein
MMESSAPDKTTGHWTQDELDALKKGMGTVGKDWRKIGEELPTRSWSQIVRKAKHLVDKGLISPPAGNGTPYDWADLGKTPKVKKVKGPRGRPRKDAVRVDAGAEPGPPPKPRSRLISSEEPEEANPYTKSYGSSKRRKYRLEL